MVQRIYHAAPTVAPRVARHGWLAVVTAVVGLLLLAQTPARASTSESHDGTDADAVAVELLQEGQQVYSQVCSSCHQPGGGGLIGQFPPLIDNPAVADTAYLEDVIENGLTGELEVGGQIYNGVMPSFSTLSAGEMEAVIAYMQAGLVVPATTTEAGDAEAEAGAEEQSSTGRWVVIALLALVGIGAVVAAPRLLTENDRLATPWLDAASKAGAIVVAVALLTVVIPDWVLTQGSVTRMSRFAQDLIGTAVWGGGLAILLLGLWYAHRRLRV